VEIIGILLFDWDMIWDQAKGWGINIRERETVETVNGLWVNSVGMVKTIGYVGQMRLTQTPFS